jgi:TrmH family RNA methyltransferase
MHRRLPFFIKRKKKNLRPLSWYTDLSDSRIRREQGFFIIEGHRAVEQVLATAPAGIDEILLTEETAKSSDNKKYAYQIRVVTEKQFKSLSSTKTPQGIAAVVRIPDGSFGSSLPKIAGERMLLLEGVQDPGNVGALVRSAAAFDYAGIILNGECADPFGPKAVQASAGSILAVWVRRTEEYIGVAKNLQTNGFSLIAADPRGETMGAGHVRRKHVIMLGSEGNGLSGKLLAIADKKVRIPMNDKKAESLNVAISGAIMMYTGAMNR